MIRLRSSFGESRNRLYSSEVKKICILAEYIIGRGLGKLKGENSKNDKTKQPIPFQETMQRILRVLKQDVENFKQPKEGKGACPPFSLKRN